MSPIRDKVLDLESFTPKLQGNQSLPSCVWHTIPINASGMGKNAP